MRADMEDRQMAIKMIVTDLDGTLVDARYQISEANRAAVREAVARGVDVMIATGRMHRSAVRYAEALGLDVPLISYNGALVKSSSGETISASYLEPSVVERVLCYVFARGWYVQSYSGDHLYYIEQTEAARVYETASKVFGEAIGRSGMLARTRDVPKLLVSVPEETAEKVAAELRSEFRNEADAVRSSATYIEIVRPGVSKARAMLAVAEKRGIDPGEIMALGDSGNDADMLRAAGLGIAMGNALPDVKAAADEVTLSCEEDGVAEAIRRHVLEV